jgi:hypothetical protein
MGIEDENVIAMVNIVLGEVPGVGDVLGFIGQAAALFSVIQDITDLASADPVLFKGTDDNDLIQWESDLGAGSILTWIDPLTAITSALSVFAEGYKPMIVYAGAGNDIVRTREGFNDVLDGGPGYDRLEGKDGNDVYFIDQPGKNGGSSAERDVIVDTGGTDTVILQQGHLLPGTEGDEDAVYDYYQLPSNMEDLLRLFSDHS